MVSDLGWQLNRISMLCNGLADNTTEQDVPTKDAQSAWDNMVLQRWKIPEDFNLEEVKHSTEAFVKKLADIEPLFAVAERRSIGTLRAYISSLPLSLATAQPRVRLLLSEPTMKKEEMKKLALALSSIDTTLVLLGLFLPKLEALNGSWGWVYTVCGVRCPAGGTMRRSHCLDPLGGSCGHRTAARRPNEQVPTPGLRRRCRWGRRGLVAR
jgi:hypothetical protein